MKNLFLFIFCFVISVFQMSVEGVFFPGHRMPDLALAFVITLVLAIGFKESFKWIVLTGILIDAGSGTVFGVTILAYFLIGWVISWIADIADIRSRKIFFLAIFAIFIAVSEIVKDLFIFSILKSAAYFFHGTFNFPLSIFSIDYLFKVLYTILAAYVVYYVFRKASRALFLEPVRLIKRSY